MTASKLLEVFGQKGPLWNKQLSETYLNAAEANWLLEQKKLHEQPADERRWDSLFITLEY